MTHGITLRIRPQDRENDRYQVEATLDDGYQSESVTITIQRRQLLTIQLDPQSYGLALFNALFQDKIREAYNRAVILSEKEDLVHVRIQIDSNAPELHGIPWERIYHLYGGDLLPLAAHGRTPFSRYTALQMPDARPATSWPLRILTVIANPADLPADKYPPIDADAEWANLQAAVAKAGPDQVRLTRLDSPASLENILRALPGHHILHLVAHGEFNAQSQQAILHLEDAQGKWRRVNEEEVARGLASLNPGPTLLFLAACDSAARSETVPFVGLAPRLVQAGIPAVIAMQTPVSMAAARQLTGDFYGHLLEHGQIDRALNQARNLLHSANNTDWSIPALFLRIRDGRIFPQEAEPTVPEAIADLGRHLHPLKLDDLERAYLRGLYADCNDVPLAASDEGTPEGGQRRLPRLQRIYVDLETTERPTAEQILDRLGLEGQRREKVRKLLTRQRAGTGGLDMAQEEMAQMQRQAGRRPQELEEELKALEIEPAAWQESQRPLSALEALQVHPQLVLLGDPGGGKSTLTRRIAGSLAATACELSDEEKDWQAQLAGGFARWLLPVRIVLSRWAAHLAEGAEGHADDLVEECVRVMGETARLPGSRQKEQLLARLTAQPATALLLLDGLDEVADPAKRRILLAAVQDFCQDFAQVPLLVTCRVRPYREGQGYQLPLAVAELAPLNPEAVQLFVQRWHAELLWAGYYRPESAQIAQTRLLTAMQDPTRQELREMAGTPLLLTMMARVNYRRGLPHSRAALYEEYVRQLLFEWERLKLDEQGQLTGLEHLLHEANVPRSSLERALNQLAHSVHGQERGSDTVDIPVHAIRAALERIHPGPEEAGAAWAVQVVRIIDQRSGLINALELHQTYRFSHRTFQEYLAARWLATGSVLAKVREKIDLEQWREAIYLALGYLVTERAEYDPVLSVIHELMPDTPRTEADWRRVLLLGEAYGRLLGPQRALETEQKKVAESIQASVPLRLTGAMQTIALSPRQRLDAGLILADLEVIPADLQQDTFVELPPLPEAAYDVGYAFRIGKYPVTNPQFRRFFEEGGYADDRPWWTAEIVKDIESLSYNEGWRKGPRYWGNERFNKPTQPVVGVSWYEAVAYCQWLTKRLHGERAIQRDQLVRLPTQAEWERAARSTHGLDYAWGAAKENFDPNRANTKESNLDQTSPVHMYPDGRTPEGVWDLAGNVWEWSQDIDTDGMPWLKGGGWWNSGDSAQASARNWFYRGRQDYYRGFRCVVVPISRK